jgi:hypothetical protein
VQAQGGVQLQRVLLFLALFAAVDATVWIICPRFGGDCLYGFFTLIAYPVILSGPVGLLVPHYALRRWTDWRGRLLISISGAVLLAAMIVLCHAAAIRLFNSFDYGEVFIRRRLLAVELALSMIYYTALSIISYTKHPDRM